MGKKAIFLSNIFNFLDTWQFKYFCVKWEIYLYVMPHIPVEVAQIKFS